MTTDAIDELLTANNGVNCFLFLGDGQDREGICKLAEHIKNTYPNISTAIYSGYDWMLDEYCEVFDYIKTGGYIEEMGDLTSPTTNQRLYKRNTEGVFEDVTFLFQKRF